MIWTGINHNKYWGFIEPVTGVTTLVVAIIIWYGEQKENWIDSLSKKLHLEFSFKDRKVLKCNRVGLSGESDIRALTQQVAKQMCHDNWYKFEPNMKYSTEVDPKEKHKIYKTEVDFIQQPIIGDIKNKNKKEVNNKEFINKIFFNCLIKEFCLFWEYEEFGKRISWIDPETEEVVLQMVDHVDNKDQKIIIDTTDKFKHVDKKTRYIKIGDDWYEIKDEKINNKFKNIRYN